MVRAIEYVSVDVVERLHRARTINSQQTKSFASPREGFVKSEGGTGETSRVSHPAQTCIDGAFCVSVRAYPWILAF